MGAANVAGITRLIAMVTAESSHPRSSFSYRSIKRACDVVCATLLLVLASPVLLLVALLIRWRMGSPVFFRQLRAGLYGRPFELVKFRTMNDAVDQQGRPLPDSERLTMLGRIIRTLSLDEFPQLWNVLRGQMSLVGPRPLLVRYLHRYSPAQMRRHDVLPGITGWAQINGRNAISWDERFQLDLWYVEHASLLLDLRILLQTIVKTMIPSGISAAQHATMPEFEGGDSSTSARRNDATTPTDTTPDDTATFLHA
jgi:lipopolysaccharide/colanic/teichoic acid biosynthesis glycosyltransferase